MSPGKAARGPAAQLPALNNDHSHSLFIYVLKKAESALISLLYRLPVDDKVGREPGLGGAVE